MEDLSSWLIPKVGALHSAQLDDVLLRGETFLRSVAATNAPKALELFDWALQQGSPLVRGFPLMNPLHVILIVALYLLIIFGGNRLMSWVRPLTPVPLQVAQNLVCMLLSVYMCAEAILAHSEAHGAYNLWGNSLGTSAASHRLARIVWIFYWSKIIEFGDTFIMVLKKSHRQISFLHLYHHGTIFLIWWAVTFYGPGGDAWFCVMLNSLVHIVMYAYYLLASVGISIGPIKYSITYFQMSQFAAMLLCALYNMMRTDKGYPHFLFALLFVYMITLLMLFGNFLLKNKPAPAKAKAATTRAQTKKAL